MSLHKDKEPPERRGDVSSCHVCGGFYAQRSAASCLCRVCHSFLYPLGHCKVDIQFPSVAQSKSDSDDSGTEEPQDFYEMLRPPPSKKPSKPKVGKKNSDELNEVLSALSHARPANDHLQDGVVESLPEDVLLAIFSHLDDISLWSASQVCTRWKAILDRQLGEALWRKYTLQRWPFLRVEKPPCSWKQLYTNMIHSSNCFLCLSQQRNRLNYAKVHYYFHQKVMPLKPSNSMNRSDISSICRDSRITHEMALLSADPLEGVLLKPVDDVVFGEWCACISGPGGSPYEGGQFYLSVSVSCRYPMDPPVVRFLTKIFHPNVSRHGDIGLDSLHHNWSLALTLSKVLLSIQSLLTDPYTKVCMEPEIGQMYRENYELYESTARMWTMLYAKHHQQSVA